MDYGNSVRYTKQEMEAAIRVIKREFLIWSGCELYTLSYLGDECSERELDHCDELGKGHFDQCIVFSSSFRSPKNGGNGFEVDRVYTDWTWILARQETGAWKLVDWGYA